MTVSIDSTAKKYHGKKASTYETIRRKQQRWDIENDTVEQFLRRMTPKTVLDVPCGTGRFIPLYDKIGVKKVTAVDVSEDMILQAKDKAKRCKNRSGITLHRKDVREMEHIRADVSVCVRFLDLIDEDAMHTVMKTLMKCSKRGIICTIRVGNEYIPKSNTATHDFLAFKKLLASHNWRITKDVPVFTQGWHIFLLRPES